MIVPNDGATPRAEVQAIWCATVVDEWARGGLRHAVVCPGSRSTPLALALDACAQVTCHVRLDERGAGFFALGLARASDEPVAIVVTSGTAAAELHAAVAEADLSSVPLLVITADRPPELHGVGAPQTMVQAGLFGGMVRHLADPGVPHAEAAWSWRSLAARCLSETRGVAGRRPGPVHLNVALREPLDAVAEPLPDFRSGPWRHDLDLDPGVDLGALADLLDDRPTVVVAGAGSPAVLGELATTRAWPLLADPRSGLRGTPAAISYSDGLLRSASLSAVLRPARVLLVGEPPASKVLGAWLADLGRSGTEVVALSTTATLMAPHHVVERRIVLGGRGLDQLLESLRQGEPALPERLQLWRALDAAADAAVEAVLTEASNDGQLLSEPLVARVLAGASAFHCLTVSSSMPVRDLEWFGGAAAGRVPVYANRGANGIDGVTSSALGAAVVKGRAALLTGDLAFLHDLTALVDGVGEADAALTLVVLDNGGGGIFDFLPQASSVPEPVFSRLFTTPRPVDLVALAQAMGHTATAVSTLEQLVEAVTTAATTDKVSVVVARCAERSSNVALHERLHAAVVAAGEALLS